MYVKVSFVEETLGISATYESGFEKFDPNMLDRTRINKMSVYEDDRLYPGMTIDFEKGLIELRRESESKVIKFREGVGDEQ